MSTGFDKELLRTKDARIASLEDALLRLVGWSEASGKCGDCDMFRAAPSCITWQHHFECAHLEDINRALKLLGREPEEGHRYDDPDAEMARLAREREDACGRYLLKSQGLYLTGEQWLPSWRDANVYVGPRAVEHFIAQFAASAPGPIEPIKL